MPPILKPDTCRSCVLYGDGCGFVPAAGTGRNGVLVVLEAAGEHEAAEGLPTVGRAGYYLWTALAKVGLEREDFRIHNVLSCRPPNNKLAHTPYEAAAIASCAPNLDATIHDHVAAARARGQSPTILALGRIAFVRVMGLEERDPILREDYANYLHWADRYGAWVVAADHPSYLMRGNHHLLPQLQFVAQRAVEVAASGFRYADPTYICDPSPATFHRWVEEYQGVVATAIAAGQPAPPLSVDIETPRKQKGKEDKLAREDDDDYTILRCSFAWREGEAVSVPWRAEYMAAVEDVMAGVGPKLFWNCPTPDQRVLTADLRWVRAGDVRAGDELVGFDAEVAPGRRNRRFKRTVVTNAENGHTAEVFEVLLSDGSTVRTSSDHPWLMKPTAGKQRKTWQWVKTKNLKRGARIPRLFEPWDSADTRQLGYLAGFYDSEGSVCVQPTTRTLIVSAGQNDGIVLDTAAAALHALHMPHKIYSSKNVKNRSLKLSGRTTEMARMLGMVRPPRLLPKFCPEMLGAVWAWKRSEVRVVSVTPLGAVPIVRLSTASHTYILEGFGAHNCNYDVPRLKNQVNLAGEVLDAMLAWHVLNSQLEKRLGYVAPFYALDARMWKHLAGPHPALYNAQDADMCLRCYNGIRADLIRANQWDVFDRHVIQLNRVLDAMSAAGIHLDHAARAAAETRLSRLLDEAEGRMVAAVPTEARRLQLYKGVPPPLRGLEGTALQMAATAASLTQVEREVTVKVCPGCQLVAPPAAHFKTPSAARRKNGDTNPCQGLAPVPAQLIRPVWAKPLAFKASGVQLANYQRALKHQAVINRREQRVTFDEDAIRQLMRKYPADPLYPTILEHREVQTLLSRYVGVTNPDTGRVVGGLRVGRDGLIHTTYTHNPETLRLASQDPNLQNLPRPGGPNDLCSIIRDMIVASPGCTLLEADYSGIEAVLVAYFARWRDGIRLAKLGMHSYLASHVLKRPADLGWSDADLGAYLKEIKKSPDPATQRVYNGCKRCVHLSGYGGTPRKMNQAEPDTFPTVKYAEWLQGVYWDVAAPVRKWQQAEREQAHRDGYLVNPFGYVLRFAHVYRNVKENGVWVKKPGEQANDVLAFRPQSTAAGIIKEAMLRIALTRLMQWLRLQVHDSLVLDAPLDSVDEAAVELRTEMMKPVAQLPLPASYGMGTHLVIDVDTKRGVRWGSVK